MFYCCFCCILFYLIAHVRPLKLYYLDLLYGVYFLNP